MDAYAVDACLLRAAALVGGKAPADVVVRAVRRRPRGLPGFTSTLDPSTVDSVDPHHQPDRSRNDRQTSNKNQKGRHDVQLALRQQNFRPFTPAA